MKVAGFHFPHVRRSHLLLRVQQRVGQLEQRCSLFRSCSGCHENAIDKSLRPGAHERLFGNPDHALGARPVGHWHESEESDDCSEQQKRDGKSTASHRTDSGVGEQIGRALHQGSHEPDDRGSGGKQESQAEKAAPDEEQNGRNHEESIRKGQNSKRDEPGTF